MINNRTQDIGTKFTIFCTVLSGDQPGLTFKWFRNGVPLSNDYAQNDIGRYRIESMQSGSIFTINPVDKQDSAKFSCQVTSTQFPELTDSISTILSVNCKCFQFYLNMKIFHLLIK